MTAVVFIEVTIGFVQRRQDTFNCISESLKPVLLLSFNWGSLRDRRGFQLGITPGSQGVSTGDHSGIAGGFQ